MKQVFLFITHKESKEIIKQFEILRKAVKKSGDVFFINTSGIEYDKELGYDYFLDKIIPGSNHYAVIEFFRDRPYDYYWSIEWDVKYTGSWKKFFQSFDNKNDDFISCHLTEHNQDVKWPWWDSYNYWRGEQLYKTFNPIYRISYEALQFLDQAHKYGVNGHHEVLLPTLLKHNDFIVGDMQGYYTNKTMAWKKNHMFLQDNKLYHPLAEVDKQRKAKKVLVVLITKDFVRDECIESLVNQDYPNYDIMEYVQKPTYYDENWLLRQNVNIARNRETTRKLALKSDAEYFFFVDSDMVYPEDALTNLVLQAESKNRKPIKLAIDKKIKHKKSRKDKHCIAGYYKARLHNEERKKIGNRMYCAHRLIDDSTVITLQTVENSLTRIDYAGLGCMLVSRELLKKIRFRPGNKKFLTFKTYNDWKGLIDESGDFCNQVYEKGYNIYIDGNVYCEHLEPLVEKKKKAKHNKYLFCTVIGEKESVYLINLLKKFLNCDVILGVYDDLPISGKGRIKVVKEKGINKYNFAKKYLTRDICNKYDYIYLWDGDIVANGFNPSRFINIMDRNNLDIAQPCLSEKSTYSHEITRKNKLFKVGRITDFVEIMLPVFSTEAFLKCKELIDNNNKWGWGYDLLWCDYGKFRMGVVDSEIVEHLRPVKAVIERNKEEMSTLKKHKGINKSNMIVKGGLK